MIRRLFFLLLMSAVFCLAGRSSSSPPQPRPEEDKADNSKEKDFSGELMRPAEEGQASRVEAGPGRGQRHR
jgi:hypothetical protein